MDFRIIQINGNQVRVGFGPIQFNLHILDKGDGKVYIEKPSSLFILEPDYADMIRKVRSEWIRNKNNN